MFHFLECPVDIAWLQFDTAAAINDDIGVQSELARVERASVLGRRLVFADPTA